MGAILVSIDRDFRQIAPRIPKGARKRFKKLSRISVECSEVQAAQRVRETMPFIELAWLQAQKKPDKRLIAVIMTSHFRVDQ